MTLPETDDAAGDDAYPPSARLPFRELSVTSLEMLADESTGGARFSRGRRLVATEGPEDEPGTGFSRSGGGLVGGASVGFAAPAGLTFGEFGMERPSLGRLRRQMSTRADAASAWAEAGRNVPRTVAAASLTGHRLAQQGDGGGHGGRLRRGR